MRFLRKAIFAQDHFVQGHFAQYRGPTLLNSGKKAAKPSARRRTCVSLSWLHRARVWIVRLRIDLTENRFPLSAIML
jgi:hypothetical protein